MDTNALPHDFIEFLRYLEEAEVEYLLIGGYAVGYYGYPRTTADMDIWVAVSPANAEKLVQLSPATARSARSASSAGTKIWS